MKENETAPAELHAMSPKWRLAQPSTALRSG
jgi:hypothetical protein